MKPNLAEFIQFLGTEIEALRSDRKINAFINDIPYIFIPEISLASCDLPARAPLMGLPLFSGYKACPHCHHPGINIRNATGRSYVRYTVGNYQKRTQKEVVDAFMAIEKNGNIDANIDIFGIKRVPPMFIFHGFDLIDGFVTDHLHCVELGVMKRLLDLWFGKIKSSKFKVPSLQNRIILNDRLLKLKPISSMSRLPKSLFERSFWKASQYSDLLLYNLYYAIPGVLNSEVVRNFRDLSAGIYMLLRKEISDHDISTAEQLLNRFVNEFERICGKEVTTMNIHLVKHLPQVVRIASPLSVYSTYGFEGNLGRLVKSIKGTRSFTAQVAFSYCLKRVEKNENIGRKQTLLKRIHDDQLENLLEELELGHSNVIFYAKFRKNDHEIITPEKCIEKKRNNRFVETTGNLFFSIVAFARVDEILYAIGRKCIIVKIENHFVEIKQDDSFQLIRTNEIKNKMIHIQFYSREYLTKLYRI